MTSVPRLGVLVLSAAAFAVTPAQASVPGWESAPVSQTGALAPTGLEFAADGSGVLTWEAYAGRKLTGLAVRSPRGVWTRAADVPGVTWGLARVHVVASRTAMAGMRAYAFGAYNRARWEVVTATGRLDGSFGPVHPLARDVRWVGSAAGDHGDLLVAWTARRDDALRVERVLPARRRAQTLSVPGIANAILALGPRGHALAAWTRGRRIEARLRSPAGRWGPTRRIDFTGPVPQSLDGAVSATGDAIVAWSSAEFRGETVQPRQRFRAAISGAAGWTTHRLQAYIGDGVAPPRTLAAFDSAGHGVLAWADAASVRIARWDGTRPQALHVGKPVSLDDLGVSRTGDVAVVFSAPTPGQGSGPGPFVTSAPRGGTFGAPVDVGGGLSAPLQGAKLAFDPVSARPTVAWTAVAGGATQLWTATRYAP